ncbi:MAG: biopolymer transporter ExbD [Deltaproteobacteria bacterium]|nr:biopolymer transporter ExbD [Deltaproteobacteria bacterium]
MAGGMDLGVHGKSRRKPLDAPLNLVPFIDLMAVTISFLVMTAVWTQISRLEISQSGGSSGAPDEGTQLTLHVSSSKLSLAANGVALADASDLASLRRALADARTRWPEPHVITVESEDSVRYESLVGAVDACTGARFDAVSVRAAN